MAATGNPNGGGNPSWPRYDPGIDEHMELAVNARSGRDLRKAECDFWDTVTLPWPHL